MKNRQPFNYHTHTYRCGHALVVDDEQYAIKAIEAGFKTLGYSDHCPYSHYSKKTDRMDFYEMQGYINSVKAIKEKYKDKIKILQGFECEYYDETVADLNYYASFSDYLILGQHNPTPEADVEYCLTCRDPELVCRYAYLVEKGLHTGKFLYLAHPDYFCGGIYDFNDDVIEATKRICLAAKQTNTPMEVNIKFDNRKPKEYAFGYSMMYPMRKFWEIVQDYDVRCIYGFDAHNPGTLLRMDHYETADKILEGLKLNFVKEELL